MHQEFNIQQLYALSTLYLCVLYLSVYVFMLYIYTWLPIERKDTLIYAGLNILPSKILYIRK